MENNPFDIEYIKQEIEFYNVEKYDKDGIRIESAPRLLNRCFSKIG